MKIRLALASITCFMLASSAQAEEKANDFGRNGLYVHGGVAAALDAASFLSNFAAFDQTSNGIGVALAGGYRFHKYFAVEGLYQWLGESTLAIGTPVKRWDATANLRVSPSGRFQPYAAIGGGYGMYEIGPTPTGTFLGTIPGGSSGAFVVRFAGGLDVYIIEQIAIYVEAAYMLTTGDLSNLDYATAGAGAMLRF